MFPFYSFLSNPIVFVFHQGHVYFRGCGNVKQEETMKGFPYRDKPLNQTASMHIDTMEKTV